MVQHETRRPRACSDPARQPEPEHTDSQARIGCCDPPPPMFLPPCCAGLPSARPALQRGLGAARHLGYSERRGDRPAMLHSPVAQSRGPALRKLDNSQFGVSRRRSATSIRPGHREMG